MPTSKTTAQYVVSQLRREDWVSRHDYASRIKMSRPAIYGQVCKLMHPSELLDGLSTGMTLSKNRVVVALDKDRKKLRGTQRTLHEFFLLKPKKPQYVQQTLRMFFRRSLIH